jgi:probable rRNA maturation factor
MRNPPARAGRPRRGGAAKAGVRASPLVVDVVARAGEARGLNRWLARAAPAAARGAVTVAVVTDRHLRALNVRHRDVDAATDVLSFPADEPRMLGDIVIARGVATRQARAAGHPFATELRVLALHGLLHLLGHDHERDDGAMARLEARLRRKAGLAAGLIERATAPRSRRTATS